jgi:fibronectin-binding autotransporter adhesin
MKTQHAAEVGEEKIGKVESPGLNHYSQFSKRSDVMNATRFIRSGLLAVLSVFLVSGFAFGQGILKNGGVIRNTGSATYKEVQNYKGSSNGTILNSGTLSTSTAGSGSGNFLNTDGSARAGTVKNFIGGVGNGTMVIATDINNNFTGCSIDNDSTVGVSTIRIAGAINNTNGTFTTTRGRIWYDGGAQTVLATTYGALVADQAGAKTLADSIVVNDSLRIDNNASLAVSTFRMNLLGAANVDQNSGTLSAASGIVRYAGDLDQSIIPTQYKVLTLTGSTTARTKTSAGALSFAASGQLTVDTNDTLYVSTGNLDLATNTPTLINSSAIKVAADASFHGGITDAGTFYYDGTGAQNIGAVTYADLRLGASGGKTFPNGGTVAVTGNYTIDPGTGARTYTNSTFQFAGTSGTQAVSNLAESFNVVQFTGAAAKTLGGTTFGANQMDLLSGTGVVTNNVTTVTLANISNVSLTIASGTELVNNGTINMNGDLENDGILTNTGTIGVY